MKQKTKKPREWWMMVDNCGDIWPGSRKCVSRRDLLDYWSGGKIAVATYGLKPILLREVLKKKRKP